MKKKHIKDSDRFSAVTHEIKNSLNPVINLSSLLIRNTSGRLTEEESSYLEVIERNGRKILHLIEELSSINGLSGNDKNFSESNAPSEMIDKVINSISISDGKSAAAVYADKQYSIGGTTRVNTREFVMLVIDDDIDNIIPVNAIIEHSFNGKGKVYHAESGGKGLDMLEKIKPDIILLDLTLPDISGLSLVKNIKHLFVKKDIPVIAFTGMDIAGDMDKMLRSGFDDVIKKPFNIDAFTQKIRKWID